MLIDKVTEFFVEADDFCREFEVEIRKHLIASKASGCRLRKSQLSDSEIISILLLFHFGQFTNFKAFYTQYVCVHLTDSFPDLVSYQRFVALKKKVAVPLMMFLKTKGLGKCRGISFVDSTHLKVCHNRRIHQHKTFKEVAERGYCSIGWFFGFKLHLIINDKGEILSFFLTKGNVDDRDFKVMKSMTENMFGKLFADKGYISKKLSDLLFGNGIQLVAKPKKNMRNVNLSQTDKILLRKRAIIESVYDELKNICKIQHTRHRSLANFLINIMAALSAYSFFPKKPSLNIQFETENSQLQLVA
ncbi:MAG: IS982 family transposase [Ekhidna sp.]|nr:IS982 family transposase [Ekhidna sp.]